MLKVSTYNIYLPIDTESNEYMLVHGYTGAVDVVTEDIYFDLKKAESDSKVLENFNDEIKDVLISRGYLTSKNELEEQELFKLVADSLQASQSKNMSLVLIPTYNCNFRCPYCFEKNLLKNGNEWFDKTMSLKMADKIFDYVKELISSGKVISNVCLYGGEPLLKENKNIIKHIVELSNESGLKISAITNGHDLDYYRDCLGENAISLLQITLDGTEKTHNERRFLAGGKPSFEKITDNIQMCLDLGTQVSVRTNLDSKNFSQIDELIRLFENKGWTKYKNFNHYFKGVQSCKIEGNTEIDDSKIINTLKTKNMHKNTYSYNAAYSMLNDLFRNLFESKGFAPLRTSFCGSASSMIVVDPFGDIYPCWEVVGDIGQTIGKLDPEGTITYNSNKSYWGDRVVQNITECSTCPYAMFCGGGCPAIAKNQNGNIYTAYCQGFKKLFNEVVPEVYKKYICDQSQINNTNT